MATLIERSADLRTRKRDLSSAEALRLKERFVPKALYQATPIVVASAEGARIVDPEGKEYIDFAAGVATLNLGHNHPEIRAAVVEQLDRYGHQSFHVATYEPYLRLAEELDRIFPGDRPTRSVLMNTGAEAVETAIRIARAATGREYVIAFQNSFHGRSELALTATGKTRPVRLPFLRSMAPNVLHAPYPYRYRSLVPVASDEELADFHIAYLERILDTQVAAEQVAAIIAEPIQGEGGIVVPPRSFFRKLRAICDRHGILLIADEVQVGMARTGMMFGIQNWDVKPDLITTAKALASGYPLAAVTGRAELLADLAVGTLGTTFGGHPVACVAALKTIEIIERDRLADRARAIGDRIAPRLHALAERHSCIGEVRGLGAIYGLELVRDPRTKEPAPELLNAATLAACERGLVTIKSGLYGNVMRTLVPLTITDDELDEGLRRMEAALDATLPA